MNAPALNIARDSVESLANALHLMRRGFGTKHTPADFMAEAAERIASAPKPVASDEYDPDYDEELREYDERLEWAADYRSAAL